MEKQMIIVVNTNAVFIVTITKTRHIVYTTEEALEFTFAEATPSPVPCNGDMDALREEKIIAFIMDKVQDILQLQHKSKSFWEDVFKCGGYVSDAGKVPTLAHQIEDAWESRHNLYSLDSGGCTSRT